MLNKRRKKNISMQTIKRTLNKHGLHIRTPCRTPSLTKNLGRWSSGRMFYGVMWPKLNLFGSGYVWFKKGKVISRRTPSPWSNVVMGESSYVVTIWRTSWILWSIRPFCQSLWCRLLCMDLSFTGSLDFSAEQSYQCIHPNQLKLGSIRSRDLL